MKTTAIRLYGKRDIRMETIDIPALSAGSILAEVISDSICMSTYKTVEQGAAHKRVPNNVAEHPVIIGHELCGRILEVGSKWTNQFKPGDCFAVQPVLDPKGSYATIGYSFETVGGDSELVMIPEEVIAHGCLLPYTGDGFFKGSLTEPMSCIVAGFRAAYHQGEEEYTHEMGIKDGGRMAILGGTGPMGLGTIDYALNGPRQPQLLVVTDINPERLTRAAALFPAEKALGRGVELHFVNAADENAEASIMELSGNKGYDDVFCLAPVRSVVEMSDRLLARDGCLNFFAGPLDSSFSATFNFYNVHYSSNHVVGTSGGTTNDLKIALKQIGDGALHPEVMITHIGGLDAVIDATMNLPKIPGGKKLIYPKIRMPLTAIDDFAKLGESSPMFAKLTASCAAHNGLWNAEAERILLESL